MQSRSVSHSKSKSHGVDGFEPGAPRASNLGNKKKKGKAKKKKDTHVQRSSVPNLLEASFQSKVVQSQAQQRKSHGHLLSSAKRSAHTKSASNVHLEQTSSNLTPEKPHRRSVSS